MVLVTKVACYWAIRRDSCKFSPSICSRSLATTSPSPPPHIRPTAFCDDMCKNTAFCCSCGSRLLNYIFPWQTKERKKLVWNPIANKFWISRRRYNFYVVLLLQIVNGWRKSNQPVSSQTWELERVLSTTKRNKCTVCPADRISRDLLSAIYEWFSLSLALYESLLMARQMPVRANPRQVASKNVDGRGLSWFYLQWLWQILYAIYFPELPILYCSLMRGSFVDLAQLGLLLLPCERLQPNLCTTTLTLLFLLPLQIIVQLLCLALIIPVSFIGWFLNMCSLLTTASLANKHAV